jgi:hypothetical protein
MTTTNTRTRLPHQITEPQESFLRKLQGEREDFTDVQSEALGHTDAIEFLSKSNAHKLIDVLLDTRTPDTPTKAPSARGITDGQVRFLSKLRDERGLSNDGITNLSFEEASAEIDRLKGTPKGAPKPKVTEADAMIAEMRAESAKLRADKAVADAEAGIDDEPGPDDDVPSFADLDLTATLPEPVDMTGMEFTVPVADGSATYRVTRDMGGFVNVEFVDGGPDGYRCAVLDERATISRGNVARLLRGRS